MKTSSKILGAGIALTMAVTAPAMAETMVGGAPMYASRNIIQNAVHSKVHTTLVAAVKEAGLVKTLEGPGPFTVFAPTNRAFDKLPAGTVSTLMEPANKDQLKTILTYHVLPGRYTTRALEAKIREGDGKATINTVEGQPLTFSDMGGRIRITDEKGGSAEITKANVMQSNGVIQVVNGVLQPK